MRWFITGATGFIGGELARQLRLRGDEVVALVRDPARAGALTSLGVTLHPGDVRSRDGLARGMEGCDGVFHLAAWYKLGAKDDGEAQSINVEGTANVIEAARAAGVKKVVYTSTVAVFSDTGGTLPAEDHVYTGVHLSTYDRTKWQAHYEVAVPAIHDGAPLVIVQPGAVYGPGDQSPIATFFVEWMRGRMPVLPARTACCWGHVEDTARAHILAMEKGRIGESYIIAGPAHTFIEAVQMAAAITGRRGPGAQAPPWLLRGLSALMRLPAAFMELPPNLQPEALRVSAGVTYLALAGKARREFDWIARPLDEGLPAYLEDLAQRHGLPFKVS